MVTLKNLNYKNEALNGALNENGQKILSLIRENPQITQRDIREQLGVSRSNVQRIMKTLVDLDVIERVGSKKTGYWKIKGVEK